MNSDLSRSDIDECDLGLDTCHENSQCVNTEGSYECRCQPGDENCTQGMYLLST